jgi:hypothetical protein
MNNKVNLTKQPKFSKKQTILAFIILGIVEIAVGFMIMYSVFAIQYKFYELLYSNKVEVTVTKFDYSSKSAVYKTSVDDNGDASDHIDYYTYSNVDCVIKFDAEVNGYTEYEYKFDYMDDNKFQATKLNKKYIMLYNDLENPHFIDKTDYIITNCCLYCLITIIVLMVGLNIKRKRERSIPIQKS